MLQNSLQRLQYAQRGMMGLTPFGMRSITYKSLAQTQGLTSNHFLCIQRDQDKPSYFTYNGKEFFLTYNESLSQLEKSIKQNNSNIKSVDFFDPDGSYFAKSSKVGDVMKRPFFTIKFDNKNEYSVVKPEIYDYQSSIRKFSPEEAVIFNQTKQFNMKHEKSLLLSQFMLSIF